jgi:parallel beta-helix repeat protein
VIRFDLTGLVLPAVQLPDITEPVDIDGSSGPGAAATVRISGENVVSVGLRLVNAGGSRIRGLTLVRFRNRAIEVNRSDGVVIEGNRIGLDGATSAGSAIGVYLFSGDGCRVGGPDPALGNVISGNVVGVRVDSRQNVVEGNDIGTLAGGEFDPRVGNTDSGILLASNADGDKANVIRNNLVAGNLNGITLESHGNFVRGNTIQGNSAGVVVRNAERNQIGGDAPADGNLITANRRDGIFLTNGNDTDQD